MISSLYFQLRYLQTLNSISAENNSTIIFPVPIDIISEMIGKVKNIIIITTIFLVLKQKSTPLCLYFAANSESMLRILFYVY